MERRKYLGGAYKDYFKSFKSEIIRADEEDLKGYVSLMKIDEVNRPLIVGETCLYDDGYSEMIFQPDGEHWRVCAMYDDNNAIIEWYFDITRKNTIDEEGNPYCDDLYLDAALLPDGQILIFDEDEIKSALDQGTIAQHEFDMAYIVLDALKAKQVLTVCYMETLCSRLRLLFQ